MYGTWKSEKRQKSKLKPDWCLPPSLIVLIDKAPACHAEIKRLNFFDFASLVSSTIAEFASYNCIDYHTPIFMLSTPGCVWYSYRLNIDRRIVIANPAWKVWNGCIIFRYIFVSKILWIQYVHYNVSYLTQFFGFLSNHEEIKKIKQKLFIISGSPKFTTIM